MSPDMPQTKVADPVWASDEQVAAQHDLDLVRRAADLTISESPIGIARYGTFSPDERELFWAYDGDPFLMDEEDLSPTLDVAQALETYRPLFAGPTLRQTYVFEREGNYQDEERRLDEGMPLADDYGEESWP